MMSQNVSRQLCVSTYDNEERFSLGGAAHEAPGRQPPEPGSRAGERKTLFIIRGHDKNCTQLYDTEERMGNSFAGASRLPWDEISGG
jgi:hypothetical protein